MYACSWEECAVALDTASHTRSLLQEQLANRPNFAHLLQLSNACCEDLTIALLTHEDLAGAALYTWYNHNVHPSTASPAPPPTPTSPSINLRRLLEPNALTIHDLCLGDILDPDTLATLSLADRI
jgi:hypothetical protein